MKILLVSGGGIEEDFVESFCQKERFDRIIAVDRGLETVDRLKLSPLTDVVGDFDTVRTDVLGKYQEIAQEHPDRLTIHTFCPEKDYTDTDLALKVALSYCASQTETQDFGAVSYSREGEKNSTSGLEDSSSEMEEKKDEIWLLGATGTRLDHVGANISLLLLPFKRGVRAYMLDAHNRIRLLSGTIRIRKEEQFGTYISLLPLTEKIRHVSLQGLKYPLQDHTVFLGESLCVSNEIVGEEAVITVGEGIAVLLETRD